MKRITKACMFSVSAMVASMAWASVGHATQGEVSFTPTGLRFSIMQIALSASVDGGGSSMQQQLYACPSMDEADCLVDVTNQAELDALSAHAAGASIAEGTYDTISLSTCAPGKGGAAKGPGYVKGTFFVPSEGKTYATVADPMNVLGLRMLDADAGIAADAGADMGAEFAAIGQWACSTKTVMLPVPLVVSKGEISPLTVVMDARLIAFSAPQVSPGMGGCRGQPDGQGRGICVSYPSIFPILGEATPELDRFLLAHHSSDANAIDDSRANAYVVVAREADGGAPITAFVRPYFSETSARATVSPMVDPIYGGPTYQGETEVPSFKVASDGSVSFITGGSLDPTSAIFPHFALSDHKGTVTDRQHDQWQYHAISLP